MKRDVTGSNGTKKVSRMFAIRFLVDAKEIESIRRYFFNRFLELQLHTGSEIFTSITSGVLILLCY